jgi:hypothetical protein
MVAGDQFDVERHNAARLRATIAELESRLRVETAARLLAEDSARQAWKMATATWRRPGAAPRADGREGA